jgi:hypothetical protein
METAFGTKNVCRVVWGDSGDEPLPTRLDNCVIANRATQVFKSNDVITWHEMHKSLIRGDNHTCRKTKYLCEKDRSPALSQFLFLFLPILNP